MVDARPATYRSLASSREYRSIFSADLLSLLGDQAAIVALSVLVYQRSESPFLAAAVYSFTFLPWAVGGPVLSALADRWPRRRVMVVCALAQAGLVGLASLPGVPLGVLVALVGVAAFLAPPFEAARGALLPEVFDDDDRYVLASSVSAMTHQVAALIGFVVGGVLAAALSAHVALAINSATFLLSACLLVVGIRPRSRPTAEESPASSLWRETVEGVRWVTAHRRVRALIALVWLSAFYLVVPEGVAASYAAALGRGPKAVGVLMAAAALGMLVGTTALTRFAGPGTRRRLMYPLAMSGTLPLLLLALDPPFVVSVVCFVVTGTCFSAIIPAQAEVMTSTDPAVRGRVFGVAATGLALSQALSVLGAGAVAQVVPPHLVIAGGGLIGLLGLSVLALRTRTATSFAYEPLDHRSVSVEFTA